MRCFSQRVQPSSGMSRYVGPSSLPRPLFSLCPPLTLTSTQSETNSLDKTFSDLNEEGYAGEETEEHLHHKEQSDQKQRQLEDENANLR